MPVEAQTIILRFPAIFTATNAPVSAASRCAAIVIPSPHACLNICLSISIATMPQSMIDTNMHTAMPIPIPPAREFLTLPLPFFPKSRINSAPF